MARDIVVILHSTPFQPSFFHNSAVHMMMILLSERVVDVLQGSSNGKYGLAEKSWRLSDFSHLGSGHGLSRKAEAN